MAMRPYGERHSSPGPSPPCGEGGKREGRIAMRPYAGRGDPHYIPRITDMAWEVSPTTQLGAPMAGAPTSATR